MNFLSIIGPYIGQTTSSHVDLLPTYCNGWVESLDSLSELVSQTQMGEKLNKDINANGDLSTTPPVAAEPEEIFVLPGTVTTDDRGGLSPSTERLDDARSSTSRPSSVASGMLPGYRTISASIGMGNVAIETLSVRDPVFDDTIDYEDECNDRVFTQINTYTHQQIFQEQEKYDGNECSLDMIARYVGIVLLVGFIIGVIVAIVLAVGK
ncbi:uncharacterized protein LOC118404003 isoform X1 [Branchiostoma floridae]|uniref:Uncharacterized protein LOC118404003 isoform X1 n=1 Tax=Branchiostoma floridae TaxID=7739 RepID=A0A9J7HFP1_BRAFL|nr:uncharacterized protein LOC118404003 isoform X1 [Branchiostoma floridae]